MVRAGSVASAVVGAAVGAGLALATGGPVRLRGRDVEHSSEPKGNTAAAALESLPTGTAAAVPSSRSSQHEVDAAADADAGAPRPGHTSGCPDGMVRVEGKYCPDVAQTCEKFDSTYLAHRGNPDFSARCLQFRPARCLYKFRRHLAFCMDRYEYPDKVGELPRVLTSWRTAQALCQRAGKRLCTEDEFNFACEGPEMNAYATGNKRDPQACNIDKPYIMPDHKHRMLPYDQCKKDPRCARELARLDQRHAIGSVNSCVSWAGVVDLNGNVNEWVTRPGEESPHRGGLKGGWWGPVRDRCRPTVIFHKEFDYGYEAGFRCCKDLAKQSSTSDAGSRGAPLVRPRSSTDPHSGDASAALPLSSRDSAAAAPSATDSGD